MPNGGILPCCFVCTWAKKNTTEPAHPKNNNALIEPIECRKHGFSVWLPSSHFCADLSVQYGKSGHSKFTEIEKLESENIYAWLTFSYLTKEHPNLPQYHSECLKLASFGQYSSWSLDQKKEYYLQAREAGKQELTRKSGNQ